MKKALLLLLIAAISVIQAHAQTRPITGMVTDAKDGAPLPGVTVKIKNTNTGTTTNGEGKFSINVQGNPVLEFTFVGFGTKEIATSGRSNIDVKLSTDEKALGEIVVVAYGTTTKAKNTGSSAQIDSKKFAERPLTNVVSALEGAAPGIQVAANSGQPGDAPQIRIRGFGSINASSSPLYVVDGVPYTGDISNLNMDDVASISVLKDAASSSMYGSRAANGVIMVTTKKGSASRSSLNVKVTQGVSTQGIPEYDRVNAKQYYPLMWTSLRNGLAYPTKDSMSLDAANSAATAGIKSQLGYNPFNVADNDIVRTDGTLNPNAQLLYGDDLDWSKGITRTGQRGDYGLSYSGGTDKTDYFASIGYVNDKGYIIQSDYERITGRVNVNTQATKWFKTGFNISGTNVKSKQANIDAANTGNFINPVWFARNMGPIYPIYAHDPKTGAFLLDETGGKIYDLGTMSELGLPSRAKGGSPGRHIIAETNYNDNLFKRNVLSARTYGEISFLKNFKFTTNISVDLNNYLASTLDNSIVGDGAPDGRAAKTSTQTTSYTLNEILSYTKQINRHSLNVLVGHENYDYTYNYLYGFRQGQIVEGNTELVNFSTTNSLLSQTDKTRIESYLSRLDYSFDDKYLFGASFRRDGSSRFQKNVRWGNFGSVSAGWRMDQEDFIKPVSWINVLKPRLSYGTAGNDRLLDANSNNIYYGYQALYALDYNNAGEAGVLQSQLANDSLKWESNKNFDAGVDFALFDSRLTVSIEYFNRQSSNLLFQVPLPLSSGMKTQLKNVGTMKNTGWELQLSGDVIRAKNFVWTMDLNLTKVKNEITKLPQENIISGTKQLSVGHSLYDYWLKQYYGVDPSDGSALYIAANPTIKAGTRTMKDGTVVTIDINNAKYHYAGSAIPDFYGSWGNTLKYRDFQLSVLVAFQKGGKTYDGLYATLMAPSAGAALHSDALKAWQKPGDITDVPRIQEGQNTNFAGTSDRWLTDASYLSLRSVRLGYVLPNRYASVLQVKGASIFVSGENLATITARKGMNPAQAFTGVTTNGYLPARILSAGINVSL